MGKQDAEPLLYMRYFFSFSFTVFLVNTGLGIFFPNGKIEVKKFNNSRNINQLGKVETGIQPSSA